MLAAGAFWLDQVVRRDFAHLHRTQPARVYARPLELYVGRGVGQSDLIEVLRILGYREAPALEATGTFVAHANAVSLWSRGFRSWDGVEPSRMVQIRFASGAVAAVTDPQSGTPVPRIQIEPIEIAQFDAIDRQDRIIVAIDDVPPDLINALLAVEDQNFYHHVGIDPGAVARATLANLLAREVVQGGSTLTQQLVKNLYLSAERSFGRKLREALMALIIELHFSKQEILQAYLNEVYLGQQGNRALHGFGLAAQHYFGKPIGELRLDETCLLSGWRVALLSTILIATQSEPRSGAISCCEECATKAISMSRPKRPR